MTLLALNAEEEAKAVRSINESRGNLNVHFSAAESLQAPIASDVWRMGEFAIQFAQLGAHHRLVLGDAAGRAFVKVVSGRLRSPQRLPFCAPRALQNTQLNGPEIEAGPEGALVALFVRPNAAEVVVRSMDELPFDGPDAQVLRWLSFEERFSGVTDYFDGVDAFIGPGFHLLDHEGDEISFVNLWTAGKGVDLSTHNHGHAPSAHAPAFAEVHLTLCNGTGMGGMYECDAPDAVERERLPVAAGFEHGPFFRFNADTGSPLTLVNGAVDYPWHGWQAGDDGDPAPSYDLVAAFETTLAYTHIATPNP